MIAVQPLPATLEEGVSAEFLELGDQLKPFFQEVIALGREARTAHARSLAAALGLPGGWNVLELLELKGPQTVPQIARSNSTSRQNCQIIVNRLRRDERIELVPNPRHKRSELVQLTNRGRALLANFRTREGNLWQGLGEGLSRNQISAAASVLELLRDRLRALAKAENASPTDTSVPALRPRLRPGRVNVTPAQPARETDAEKPSWPFEAEPTTAGLPYNLL